MKSIFVFALLACGCDEAGRAYVWAGSGAPGFDGDGRAIAESRLYYPLDVEFAADGRAYVLDWNNHRIRRVTPDGTFETVVGFFIGDGDEEQQDLTVGAPGETVSINHPTDLMFEPDGTLVFAAWHNHKLRRFDPRTGLVRVQGGRGPGFRGDGGPVADALFDQPKSIVRAADGSVYVLDQRNERIRKIAPGGTITTVAGTGTKGYAGDGGDPRSAQFHFDDGTNPQPSGALALGPDGRLYVSDGANHRIRRIDFAANTIETIAGTGTTGPLGDGGPAIAATFDDARDLEFGPDGRLYVADTGHHAVRAIDLKTGQITTIAGTGRAGAGEAGGPAGEVALSHPFGIAFDAEGDLYLADTFNNRILRVVR